MPSVTYLQETAEFLREDGCPTFVYVLTDFDPSGLSIAETVERELIGRARPVEVERLAVTREQIDLYGLSTRPTKPPTLGRGGSSGSTAPGRWSSMPYRRRTCAGW